MSYVRFVKSMCQVVVGVLLAGCSPIAYAADVNAKAVLPSGADAADVVVSLTPVHGPVSHAGLPLPTKATLVQKNKTFSPHVLVVAPGAVVEFPNRDPFFHNVFSLFEGKRFDLGLYEAGSSRSVTFDRPGVSYIFCNIHPKMSAIVIALSTPYYAISDRTGNLNISAVPEGEYQMQVWAEGLNASEMEKLSRSVDVRSARVNLGTLEIPATETVAQHKNKYGKDYETPASSTDYNPR